MSDNATEAAVFCSTVSASSKRYLHLFIIIFVPLPSSSEGFQNQSETSSWTERRKTTQSAERKKEIEVRIYVKICCWWMRENGMRLHIPIIYKNQTLTLSLKYMSNALREEISLQSWQQMHSSSEKKKHLIMQTLRLL